MKTMSLRLFNSGICFKFSKRLSLNYSTGIPYDARRKWGLTGAEKPRSILEDDDAVVDLTEDNDAVNGSWRKKHPRQPSKLSTPHEWKMHREVMRKDFPEGWAPPRKLSREAMDGLRRLHNHDPDTFTTPLLAERFKISPEAVRRILKSKWEPSEEKRTKLLEKERKSKADFIKLNRLKERMEAIQLAEHKKLTKRYGHRPSSGDGGTIGIDSQDRLTFE